MIGGYERFDSFFDRVEVQVTRRALAASVSHQSNVDGVVVDAVQIFFSQIGRSVVEMKNSGRRLRFAVLVGRRALKPVVLAVDVTFEGRVATYRLVRAVLIERAFLSIKTDGYLSIEQLQSVQVVNSSIGTNCIIQLHQGHSSIAAFHRRNVAILSE